jgi:hypothetical protein
MFRPYVIFNTLGCAFLIVGLIPFISFGVHWLSGNSRGHLQSLIFGSSMLIGAFLSFTLLVISDLLRTNRILAEDQLERIKEIQYKK